MLLEGFERIVERALYVTHGRVADAFQGDDVLHINTLLLLHVHSSYCDNFVKQLFKLKRLEIDSSCENRHQNLCGRSRYVAKTHPGYRRVHPIACRWVTCAIAKTGFC